MKNVRIGNDITMKWSIYRNGEAEDFTGKQLSVNLLEPFSNSKAKITYIIEENVINITFFGKDQKRTGLYTLKLVENENQPNMYTIDHCNPFTLVSKSCMAGGKDDCSNIKVTSIALESNIEVPAKGDSAYEIALKNGFEGTEKEWLASLRGEQGIQGIQGVKGDKGDKGDRGDAFVYENFTAEQIEDLKRPATEAAVVANQAATNANEAAESANTAANNTNQVIIQSQEQTNKALEATNTANSAATNANEKAALAEKASETANSAAETANASAQAADEKATLANEAATKANESASKADASATNADEKAALAETATNHANEASDNANETANNPTYIGEDNYVYVYNKITKTYDKTDIFTRGKDFDVEVVYESVAELNADTTVYKDGLFALINTDDVEDPDNARLYVRRNGAWHFLIDMSGAIGFTGKTPQITIGNVVGGDTASASLSPNGTDDKGNPKFLLNLVLPKGEQGIQGEKGDKGDKGDRGEVGYTYTPSVDDEGNLSWTNNGELANPETKNIRGPQGIQGIQGIQGERGPQGEKGETYDDTELKNRVTTLENSAIVSDGTVLKIIRVDTLPDNPEATTLYLIPESE